MTDEKDLGADAAAVDDDTSVVADPRQAAPHTPGPWYWSEGGHLIQTSHLTRDVWKIPRNDADASLIASAPELLAALKALTQDSRFSLAIGGNPHAVAALVEQVEAAIAKAEGRS